MFSGLLILQKMSCLSNVESKEIFKIGRIMCMLAYHIGYALPIESAGCSRCKTVLFFILFICKRKYLVFSLVANLVMQRCRQMESATSQS